MRSVGLFCGTFNPIHTGHLLLAECARDQFKLEKIIFVTSPRPPHRNDLLLDGKEREAMVLQAVAYNPAFEVSSIELEREGPSYTIDTIKHFKKQFGKEVEICLLLGMDNLRQIKTWRAVDEICALTKLLVAPRFSDEGNTSDEKIEIDAKWEMIDFPTLDISSTLIRQRLSKGQSVLYMVPEAVNEILLAEGYYK